MTQTVADLPAMPEGYTQTPPDPSEAEDHGMPALPDGYSFQQSSAPQADQSEESRHYGGASGGWGPEDPAIHQAADRDTMDHIKQMQLQGHVYTQGEIAAMIDAGRKAAGSEQRVSSPQTAAQSRQQVATATAQDNGAIGNLQAGAAQGVLGGINSLAGIVDPNQAAANMRDTREMYNVDPTSIPGKVGQIGGGLIPAIPALMAGPAAVVSFFAGQGFGGAREEVAQSRSEGQNISSQQEAGYAGLAGTIQGILGLGLGSTVAGKVAPSILKQLTPGMLKAIEGTDGSLIRPLIARTLTNAGVGASENVVATIAQNIAAKGTGVDPNRPITQGAAEAAAVGGVLAGGGGLLHEAMDKGGGENATQTAQDASAQPGRTITPEEAQSWRDEALRLKETIPEAKDLSDKEVLVGVDELLKQQGFNPEKANAEPTTPAEPSVSPAAEASPASKTVNQGPGKLGGLIEATKSSELDQEKLPNAPEAPAPQNVLSVEEEGKDQVDRIKLAAIEKGVNSRGPAAEALRQRIADRQFLREQRQQESDLPSETPPNEGGIEEAQPATGEAEVTAQKEATPQFATSQDEATRLGIHYNGLTPDGKLHQFTLKVADKSTTFSVKPGGDVEAAMNKARATMDAGASAKAAGNAFEAGMKSKQGEANALQESGSTGVLQREQRQTGEGGGGRGRVEQGQQGETSAQAHGEEGAAQAVPKEESADVAGGLKYGDAVTRPGGGIGNTKAALKKAYEAMSRPKNPTLGSLGGAASDFVQHATNIAVAIIKDLANAGKHGFEHFVKAVSENVGNPRVRAFMLRGEKGPDGKMYGGARDLYNAARTHEDITAHGLENTMTPEGELPKRQSDINVIAQLSDEKIAARAAERAAARAAPAKPPSEAQTIREATVKPTETVKGTIKRTTGLTDEGPTIPVADALRIKLQALQKALGKEPTAEEKAFLEHTVKPTEKLGQTVERTTGVSEPKEATQEAQRLVGKLTAEEKGILDPGLRAGFLADLKDATTQKQIDKAVDRLQAASVDLRQKAAMRNLRDTIGPVKREAKGPTLASDINEDLGVKKPPDPFAGGRIDPKKQTPVARDALTDIVGSLREPDGTAKGAGKLADFIQSERDAGHSNDVGMTEEDIKTLRGLEGKRLAEMSPEETQLVAQAVQHAAFLGEQYNEANAHSRASEVKAQAADMTEGMQQYHPEPLKQGKRGELDVNPKKNPVMNFVGNVLRDPFRFLKLNLGQGGEKMWRRLVDGQTKAFEAVNTAKDVLKAARDKLGITDKAWLAMSQEKKSIFLGMRRIDLSPREIISFINGWGRESTQRDMQRAGIVPKRLKGQPSETFKITPADAQKIMDAATPAEKEIARVMQDHLVNSQLTKDANVASVRESGFEKLTEPGYWPRARDFEQAPRAVVENMRQFRDAMLKDSGFLKDAPGSATAPVLLEDAGDVFNRHVAQVAKFAHLNDATRDMTMIQNDPSFSVEARNRLGRQFGRQLTDTMRRLTGMEDPIDIPGAKVMQAIRGRIATGELMGRLTSALNHFTGDALAVNKIPEGWQATFFKNLALKAVPDMPLVRDMESRNGYLRNRGTQKGSDLESPVDVESPPKGRSGRALDAAGQVGTAHIRLSDRLGSAAAYKTFIEKYQADHPGADDEAAKNWAAKQTEYTVRQTGTASTPFENSYFAQRVGRVPGLNLLTLFQSKTSAMRNIIDEAYQDWRVDKSTANTRRLATAGASVAAMVAAYAGVAAVSSKIKQGFQSKTQDERHKQNVSEATQLASHIADVIAPGIGGTAVSDLKAAITKQSADADIVTQTGMKAGSDFMDAIKAGRKGDIGTTIEKIADTLNGAGKFFGVSAEQPTQYAEGLLKGAEDTDPKHLEIIDLFRAGEDDKARQKIDELQAAGKLSLAQRSKLQAQGKLASDDAAKFLHMKAENAVEEVEGMSAADRQRPIRGAITYAQEARNKTTSPNAQLTTAERQALRARLDRLQK